MEVERHVNTDQIEDVKQLVFMNNSKAVHDFFGCIPHANTEVFAASPDGICDTQNPVYAGRMYGD